MSFSEPEHSIPLLSDEELIPPIPRPSLKRSASLASLPTPPRTRTRKRRGRGRGDSSSDESASEEEGRGKRRRVDDDQEEDAFWGGEPKERGRPLVYRRLLQQQQEKKASTTTATTTSSSSSATTNTAKVIAPVSPPPSHRKPAPAPSLLLKAPSLDTVTPSPPSTPKAKKTKKLFALRDSPDNPFLVTEQGEEEGKEDKVPSTDVSPSASEDSPGAPKTPGQEVEEKPFVTYVFRGTRRTYANPYFNPRTGRAYSPPVGSNLPPDHPDFEPDERCGPRVLFDLGKLRSHGKKGKNGKSKAKNVGDSDDEEEGAEEIKPKKLDFGRLMKKSAKVGEERGALSGRKKARSLLAELGEAREREKRASNRARGVEKEGEEGAVEV